MKRFSGLRSISVFVVVLLGAGIFAWCYFFPESPPPMIPATDCINYNNYLCDNSLEHKNGHTVWSRSSAFGQQVLLSSGNGEVEKLSGVTMPCQIWEDRIFFVRRENLWQKPLEGGREQRIADTVSSFIVAEGNVYYLCQNELYRYDLSSGTVERIADGVLLFYFHDGQVFTVDMDGVLSCMEPDGHWEVVCRICIDSYPFFIMPQRTYVIELLGYGLRYIDTSDGSTTIVPLIDNEYVNHRISFICDEERTFVSFHATVTDGSVISKVEHPNNGLWVIDPETKVSRKICEETFDGLYLFGEDGLFGTKNDVVYLIDPHTGQVERI